MDGIWNGTEYGMERNMEYGMEHGIEYGNGETLKKDDKSTSML